MAWGGVRGISQGPRSHINKNNGKNTGLSDRRGDKSRGCCLMFGTVTGEQAKPWVGKALWAQSPSGRAGDFGFP